MCIAEDHDHNKRATPSEEPSGCEKIGNQIDDFIRNAFYGVGKFVSFRPWTTIALSIVLAVVCGGGFMRFTTENRPDELWVPQGTIAEVEEQQYLAYFPPSTRINTMIISDHESNGGNVLTREALEQALELQMKIASTESTFENTTYTLTDLCTKAGGSCASSYTGVCQCLIAGILKMWNYDVETFRKDEDFMATLNQYGSKDDLNAALGNAVFDENNVLVSAEAFTVTYFLDDRTIFEGGSETDPINEEWEWNAFLMSIQEEPTPYTELDIDYFSSRSFSDEFGDAISGDLALVNISYIVIFVFLGATLGRIRCGPGSRWTLSLAALVMIGLSTLAGFGISAAVGLFFGPVHSLLPFILLGIGVDDW
jgi:Niemann-Pick C1 protein